MRRGFSKCRHVFCRPLMFQEVFGRRVGKLYFEMLACSCKGRRFQNRCVKCGTTCSPVFTVELILIFFVQTTLFFTCFQKICQVALQKNFFSILNISFFTAFFPIKCCLFRLITALSRFFYFFLLTQPCFYLLSKICQATLQKNFFSFVNLSLFLFFPTDCCPFPIITAGICFFLLTTPFVKL